MTSWCVVGMGVRACVRACGHATVRACVPCVRACLACWYVCYVSRLQTGDFVCSVGVGYPLGGSCVRAYGRAAEDK
jgi:hypothetical protein